MSPAPSPAVADMTAAEAQAATAKIKAYVAKTWVLLLEVHERKGYRALGYNTFEEYLATELDVSRSRGYQLLDQGRVTVALAEAAGVVSTNVDIREADARRIKPVIDAVTDEVAERVGAGENPEVVIPDVLDTVKRRQAETADLATAPAGTVKERYRKRNTPRPDHMKGLAHFDPVRAMNATVGQLEYAISGAADMVGPDELTDIAELEPDQLRDWCETLDGVMRDVRKLRKTLGDARDRATLAGGPSEHVSAGRQEVVLDGA